MSAVDVKAGTTVTLRDGRRLGYAEYGDPDGRPVLYFHGTPGSRLDGSGADDVVRMIGLRVFAVERPGYGLSTFLPRRAIASWPADVAELADALGIERFGVYGYSYGGPYAAVCAHALPDRVERAALLAGQGPPDTPGFRDGMGKTDAVMTRIAPRLPWLASLGLNFALRTARGRPDKFVSQFEGEVSEPDQAILQAPEARALLVATVLESMRNGPKGIVRDYQVMAGAPWGFDPGEIRVPVALWHGERDASVPHAHSRHLAERIPGAELHTVEGAGHLFPMDPDGIEPVLRWLAA